MASSLLTSSSSSSSKFGNNKPQQKQQQRSSKRSRCSPTITVSSSALNRLPTSIWPSCSLPTTILLLIGLLLFGYHIGSVDCAMQNLARRQAPLPAIAGAGTTGSAVAVEAAKPSGGSTSLALAGSGTATSLQRIIFSSLQSIIGGPLRLLQQLFMEYVHFLRTYHFRDLFDVRFLQQIATRLPARLFTYWSTFVEMESECVHRTICDLADYSSRRMPKWLEQIVLIYLNTFASTHPFYQVMINGISVHRCAVLYAECDVERFMERVRTNVTNSVSGTMEPIKSAFKQLINVTTSTVNSLVVEDEAAAAAGGVSNQLAPGRPSTVAAEDEDEETEIDQDQSNIEREFPRAAAAAGIGHYHPGQLQKPPLVDDGRFFDSSLLRSNYHQQPQKQQ